VVRKGNTGGKLAGLGGGLGCVGSWGAMEVLVGEGPEGAMRWVDFGKLRRKTLMLAT
jgi:hypothetical protein